MTRTVTMVVCKRVEAREQTETSIPFYNVLLPSSPRGGFATRDHIAFFACLNSTVEFASRHLASGLVGQLSLQEAAFVRCGPRVCTAPAISLTTRN
jgi:hypothetical protein